MLLFAATTVIVLKFFGELFLLFLVSALISHILKIDKDIRGLNVSYHSIFQTGNQFLILY